MFYAVKNTSNGFGPKCYDNPEAAAADAKARNTKAERCGFQVRYAAHPCDTPPAGIDKAAVLKTFPGGVV